jgi:hypothetical protein
MKKLLCEDSQGYFNGPIGKVSEALERMQGEFVIERADMARGLPPVFFVSVDCKGVRFSANLLESTLMDILIGVASKGFTGRVCLQKSNWLRPDDFEGVRMTAWRAHID